MRSARSLAEICTSEGTGSKYMFCISVQVRIASIAPSIRDGVVHSRVLPACEVSPDRLYALMVTSAVQRSVDFETNSKTIANPSLSHERSKVYSCSHNDFRHREGH